MMSTALLSVFGLMMRITQLACFRALDRNGERLRRSSEPTHDPKVAGLHPAPAKGSGRGGHVWRAAKYFGRDSTITQGFKTTRIILKHEPALNK